METAAGVGRPPRGSVALPGGGVAAGDEQAEENIATRGRGGGCSNGCWDCAGTNATVAVAKVPATEEA